MDLNKNAFRIVKQLTEPTEQNPRSAGARIAGKSGGAARAKALSAEHRLEIATKANEARWKRVGKMDRGGTMSEKMINNIRELTRSIEENTPRVLASMAKGGREPDLAIVNSAAKYYQALEKLSKE